MKISESEIHLWFVHNEQITDEVLLERYLTLLSRSELAQHKRFYFDKHKRQYLVTRALVRTVLSLYVDNISPDKWQFGKNAYNKPYICNHSLPFDLRFNISHTDKMIVLAVVLDSDIGVDVEYLPRRSTGLEIAKRYFSDIEFQHLSAIPVDQQSVRFLDLWTLKEAYIKARGMGLSMSLNHFSFIFPAPGKIELSFNPDCSDDPRNWSVWQIKPGNTHVAGLAFRNPEMNKHHHIRMYNAVPLTSVEPANYSVTAQSRTSE